MKAEELQIGDIVICEVYFFDDDTDKEWYEKHPIRINGVSENSDLWLDGRECMYIGEYLDDCDNEDMGDFEPMPLTDAMLKINGFKNPYGYSSVYFPPERHDVYVEINDSGWGLLSFQDHNDECYPLVSVQYVHELQHALRLIGLDKLANNFKIK